MTEVVRSAEVTLVLLGQRWEFLPIVEGATTLLEILHSRRIPGEKEVRLNGTVVDRCQYGERRLQAGDVIVVVPMVEGGAAGTRWVRLPHVPREAEAGLIKARIPFRRLPQDNGVLVPAKDARAARILVWKWWTRRHDPAVRVPGKHDATTPEAPGIR